MAGSSKHKDSNRSSTKTRNAEEGSSKRKRSKARDAEEVSQVQADPELAALSVPHDNEAINGAPSPAPSEQAYEEVGNGEADGNVQADGAVEDDAGARDTDEDEFGDLMANTDRVTAYQGSTECSAGPRDSISIADSLPQMELSGTTDVCFKRVAGAIVSKATIADTVATTTLRAGAAGEMARVSVLSIDEEIADEMVRAAALRIGTHTICCAPRASADRPRGSDIQPAASTATCASQSASRRAAAPARPPGGDVRDMMSCRDAGTPRPVDICSARAALAARALRTYRATETRPGGFRGNFRSIRC